MCGRDRGEAVFPVDGDPVEQRSDVVYFWHLAPLGRARRPGGESGYEALFSLNSFASQPLPAVLGAGAPSSMTIAPGSG